MYIEQVNNKNFNPILYLPIPLGFLALIIINYISTSGMDTEKMLHDIIDKLGTNLAFVLLVAPLSVGCLIVFFLGKVYSPTKYQKLNYLKKESRLETHFLFVWIMVVYYYCDDFNCVLFAT